jgi:hypothetical protein
MLQDQQTIKSYYFHVSPICSPTYAYMQALNQLLPCPLQRILCNCSFRHSSPVVVATSLVHFILRKTQEDESDGLKLGRAQRSIHQTACNMNISV